MSVPGERTRHRHAVISVPYTDRALSGETGSLQLCVRPQREKLLSKEQVPLPKLTPLKAHRHFQLRGLCTFYFKTMKVIVFYKNFPHNAQHANHTINGFFLVR